MTEYCSKCHTSYGSAEPRVAIDAMRTMHRHCYEKHLAELKQRAERTRPQPVVANNRKPQVVKSRPWSRFVH